jgi:colicin import membrane protein
VEFRVPELDEPFAPEVERAASEETVGWFAGEEGNASGPGSSSPEAPGDIARQRAEPEPAALDVPEPDSSAAPSPDREVDPTNQASPEHELLESLSRSVGEVERLLRETVREHDDDHEAASAESERRLAALQADLDRERGERADAERMLREQLETDRAARDESERRLREEAEAERASREAAEQRLREELETERSERAESERALRAELETERSERGGTERGLREELETERGTQEALATELAAVRTARDDLARRVASARDLLELGARPFVPLNGRDRSSGEGA